MEPKSKTFHDLPTWSDWWYPVLKAAKPLEALKAWGKNVPTWFQLIVEVSQLLSPLTEFQMQEPFVVGETWKCGHGVAYY